MRFSIDAWHALAPGLDSPESWRQWLSEQGDLPGQDIDSSLKSIPPMIRRRFRVLGKSAIGAALPLLEDGESMPVVFSSRHGDTDLAYSLLETIAQQEPISPAAFSIAVHNAIGGLFSIARQDRSEITAIAPARHIVLQTLWEVLGQLQDVQRLLCVIYDIPLAEFFSRYEGADPFPYAIAMIISRGDTRSYELSQHSAQIDGSSEPDAFVNSEPMHLMSLLSGLADQVSFGSEGSNWMLSKVA